MIDDRFIVEKTLGQGGMGKVLRVYDKKLSRRVALKMLNGIGRSSTSLARFMREARTLAQLESDYVARIMDVAVARDGFPYIIIEYLEGQTLKAHLAAHGPPSSIAAATYVLEACDALHEAHELGILHRDIKPSNLFLAKRRDGAADRVKVLDFGIAKGISGGLTGAGLTDRFVTLGTPRYIAPERLRSAGATDRRSDVWALGAVLYELLAGRPAFPGQGIPAVMAQIASGKVPEIRRVRWDIAPVFSEIIQRCLHPDPGQRFPTAQALADALLPYSSKANRHSAVTAKVPSHAMYKFGRHTRAETIPLIRIAYAAEETEDTTTRILRPCAALAPATPRPMARPGPHSSQRSTLTTDTSSWHMRQRRETWLVVLVVLSSTVALSVLITSLADTRWISQVPEQPVFDTTPNTPDLASTATSDTARPVRPKPVETERLMLPPVDVQSPPIEPTSRSRSKPRRKKRTSASGAANPVPTPSALPPAPRKTQGASKLDGTELFDDIR